MKIRSVITDDEPVARKGLQGYIAKIDFLELAAVCEDAVQLTSVVKQQPIDLLFLDIEMPYITGIDFLKTTKNPPKVIFTTAYEKYAIAGYELDVLDYLLKPISFERFLKSANKAYDYFNSLKEKQEGYTFVKSGSRLEKIVFEEILFIEAMENYIAIYIHDKKIIAHSTLKAIADLLPSSKFIQPHKSYIAAVDKINSIEGNVLHIGKFQVPVSKYQKDVVMEKIVQNNLLKK